MYATSCCLSSTSEQLLIEAAKADPSRFGELYEQHFDRIFAYVMKRVRERAAAQDLTADVFHSALTNLRKFEWRGVPFAAWLYRIASNAVADHWRQRVPPEEAWADRGAAGFAAVEHRATLARMLAKLSDGDRRVLVMRFFEGLSIRETARRLGRSEGAVKQLQWRAIQKLRHGGQAPSPV